MKKLIRRINRFLFLDDERIKNQLNLYKLLENEDALSESENKAMLWYFKKVLKKELNKYVPINEMIDALENKKTSEEV
ncbi:MULTISPECIES: hypothetical protein [unclassified Empedobacter]|uniref:hypothetical protein n=1 Tax=unclassified Empedobacter TaxID=2643773 RepID=UPI0025B9DAC5|nr:MULTISPECIES: hypothetical protein [unclassified Empedobacter]